MSCFRVGLTQPNAPKLRTEPGANSELRSAKVTCVRSESILQTWMRTERTRAGISDWSTAVLDKEEHSPLYVLLQRTSRLV